MRISDWSSDVCSSDLRRRRADELIGEDEPRDNDHDRRRHIGDLGPKHTEESTHLGLRLTSDSHAGTPRRPYSSPWPQGQASGGVRPAGSLVSSSPQAASSWRSEEHTSELQSLMRISYAVFC